MISSVVSDIPSPISAFLQETYLYDLDPNYTSLVPCTIFGIMIYKNEQPTFRAMINGAIFDYLPFFAFQVDQASIPSTEETAVWLNSPDNEFILHSSDYLARRKVCRILKEKGEPLVPARYLFSLEWFGTNNENAHVFLHDGGFYLRSNYHILFSNQEHLPDYKKLKHSWII